MNKNFTILRYIVLFTAVLFSSLQSKADDDTTNYAVNFISTPVLISGIHLKIGAIYKFSNVINGTSAVVTIVSATGGATVGMLDDNTLTKPEAFSPVIIVPAHSTGMVEFKIEFFKGNSNNPRVIDTLRATAMDIDGSADLHEMDALNMGGGTLSFMTSAVEINVLQSGTQFTAVNIAGREYTGVDTSAKQVMFTVTNASVSSFTYKAGCNNQYATPQARQKGIYFKGFTYPLTTTLPVKYRSFNAVVADKSVLLKWITEEEINNNYFEVERSFNGRSFSTIAIVLDGFSNGSLKNYETKDNSADLSGKTVVYYRLKQIDKDGAINYSTILTVRMQANAAVVMQVSPNPFVEKITVVFSSFERGNAEIRITNINGQTVLSKPSTIAKGLNNLQIEGLNILPAGIYVARLIMNGEVIGSQKIIK